MCGELWLWTLVLPTMRTWWAWRRTPVLGCLLCELPRSQSLVPPWSPELVQSAVTHSVFCLNCHKDLEAGLV